MAKGDHLFYSMGVYTHHGIDLGDGTVAHWYSGLPGNKTLVDLPERMQHAQIRITSLEEFHEGHPVHVRDYAASFAADTVVARARERVGEVGYDLCSNNCEHFATWCKTGQSASGQITSWTRWSRALGGRTAARLALRRIARLGPRYLGRGVTPWLVLADAGQHLTEVATANRGQDPERARRRGRQVGLVGSVGIGLAAGGPLGAALSVGTWWLGDLVSKKWR